MKKHTIKGLAFIAVAGSIVTSCDLMKDLEYKVTPNPLEMHGDSVRVKVDVTFPEKGIKKKASAEITPMLGGTALKSVTFLGEKATGNGTTIQYKPGGKYTYTDVIAYKPEFEASDLTITGKISKGGKEKKTIDPIKIADATIVTPLLVNKDFKVIFEKDAFQRVTEQSTSAQINFDKAKFNVKPAEMKDADIKALEKWLADAEKNQKIAIKSTSFTGFASPEGEQGKNESLSTDRANSAKDAATTMVTKSKTTKVNPAGFTTAGRGEDWEGFKAELSKSNMNEDEKQLVIRVLEMYKDPVQREQEMRNMAKTFTFLEKNILPKLRRTELKVTYDLTGYYDEELVALSKSSIDSLDVEEILFTATLTKDLNEKLRLYNEAIRLYPSDHRAYNNAGVILYMQNKMSEAKGNFEKANSIKDNAIAKNNLGAIAGVSGDRKKAKELLAQANGAGEEVKYNLGVIQIQDGKYSDAIGNLGKDNFNKALAQLLNGDSKTAVNTIDASADKESAQGFYLKAVAAARQDNLNSIVSNLKSAIAKDASLKAKALSDREFLKYVSNAAFTAVAN
jgi:Flp pilus assembly protein TadD/outer membrane protein OmpA-like peptidoglycan-associated protein